MTRAEAEHQIAEHMEAIIKIAKEYSPESRYFTATYIEQDGRKSYYFENAHFEDGGPDADHPLHYYKRINEPWNDLLISKDPVTETFEIKVDGEPRYEHLAEDEFTEVMHQFLMERKE